nr:unnamed protein product [Callosobruchus chinensis]
MWLLGWSLGRSLRLEPSIEEVAASRNQATVYDDSPNTWGPVLAPSGSCQAHRAVIPLYPFFAPNPLQSAICGQDFQNKLRKTSTLKEADDELGKGNLSVFDINPARSDSVPIAASQSSSTSTASEDTGSRKILQTHGSELSTATTATALETKCILLRTAGERIFKRDDVIGPKSICRGKLP